VFAYAGAEEVFIVTRLDTVIAEIVGRRDEHSGQEIAIIQLELRD
jgi:hypothetical protein